MHDHLRRPLNFEVGEGFAQPDLGRTRLVDRPGWWLAARRVGQAEPFSQLGAEPLVAGAANSTSVIGVELLAALKGRRLSPAQPEQVIATTERLTPGFAPLIVLLAFTGMRIREALGLRWRDVDLDEATIRLRWQLTKDDRRYVSVKTDAGVRDIPILPALRRRLIPTGSPRRGRDRATP
jgi:integrase